MALLSDCGSVCCPAPRLSSKHSPSVSQWLLAVFLISDLSEPSVYGEVVSVFAQQLSNSPAFCAGAAQLLLVFPLRISG